jgi:hypothetical protein
MATKRAIERQAEVSAARQRVLAAITTLKWHDAMVELDRASQRARAYDLPLDLDVRTVCTQAAVGMLSASLASANYTAAVELLTDRPAPICNTPTIDKALRSVFAQHLVDDDDWQKAPQSAVRAAVDFIEAKPSLDAAESRWLEVAVPEAGGFLPTSSKRAWIHLTPNSSWKYSVKANRIDWNPPNSVSVTIEYVVSWAYEKRKAEIGCRPPLKTASRVLTAVGGTAQCPSVSITGGQHHTLRFDYAATLTEMQGARLVLGTHSDDVLPIVISHFTSREPQ